MAIEKSNLTGAYTDITSRNILISANIFIQFSHKTLTESHDLAIGFAFGIEIGSAFTTADWQASQRVFEYLLKAQEFQNTLIDGWMKAQTTFIRANSTVELYAISFIYLYLSIVVHPRYPEGNNAFWFY